MTDTTRRRFLKGFLSGLLATAAAGPAFAHGDAAATAHANLSGISAQALRNSDVLMLGDSNHFNPNLMAPLGNGTYIDTLAREGVTDLYLEMPQSLQPFVDSFAQGKLDRQLFIAQMLEANIRFTALSTNERRPADKTFVTRYGHLADAISNAARNGMRVHFADPQDPDNAPGFFKAVTSVMSGSYSEQDGIDAIEGLHNRFAEHDPKVAHNIHKTMRGKAVIFYGMLHMIKGMPDGDYTQTANIDDALRALGRRVTTIVLNDEYTPSDMRDVFKQAEDMGAYTQPPNYYYQPKTDASVSGETLARTAERTVRQATRRGLFSFMRGGN